MINRRIRVVLALALLATGCKSATTSLTAPTSPTTSAPTAGTSPASTSTSSSTSTSAAPTTTTISPLVVAEAEVRAAVDAFERVDQECARASPNCDVSTFDAVALGSSLDTIKRSWANADSSGWAIRHLERYRYVIEKVEFPEPNAPTIMRAIAFECVADGSVTVKPGAAPDGSDVIINEAYATQHIETEFRRDDEGRWRAYEVLKNTKTFGGDTCPNG